MFERAIKLAVSDDFLSNAKDADYLIEQFSRENVEKGLIGDALDRLLHLSDSKEWTEKFESSVSFCFEGYDEDPRDLAEIPEVRAFMQKLTKEWPFWFHFVEKELTTINIIFALNCECDVIKDGDQIGIAYLDYREVGAFGTAMFEGVQSLYEMHGFSDAFVNKSMNNINKVLDQYFGGANG